MRIVFFGTPEFAVESLAKIYNSNHEVAAVVTAPDKERGRGRKVSYTPVKQFAIDNNIPVLQPQKMKDQDFIDELKNINADLFVVVAFRILPKEIYSMPAKGSFNLHGSLLPKYRGAAPIQRAIINGETETGVTTFFLQDKVDTGNIIDYKKVEIKNEDDLGSIHDKLMEIGSDLVVETINKIEEGSVNTKEQDDWLASPAPKIFKEDCKIDWNQPAQKIQNLIRGLSPYPASYFEMNGTSYKIYKSKISDKKLEIGKVEQTKNEIFIGTADYAIQILELQPQGRKRMQAEAFLRGYTLV